MLIADRMVNPKIHQGVCTVLEFNGKTYDIEQDMFDTFKAQVDKKYAALPDEQRAKALESILAAFLKPDKTYAKVQRAAELKEQQTAINDADAVKAVLPKLGKAFHAYTAVVTKLETDFGGKVKVDPASGDIALTLPVDPECPVTIGLIFKTFGAADIALEPESHEDDARTVLVIKGGIETAKAKRDAYLALLKQLSDAVPSVVKLNNCKFNWDPATNAVVLTDQTQRQPGAPRVSNGGEKAWGGRVRWNGKEYSGSNKELAEMLQADGFKFSESFWKWKTFSYVTATDSHHVSKDIEVLEKFTGEEPKKSTG